MKSFIVIGVGVWHKKESCHICGNTNGEIHLCEICDETFCESCSATYNQFSQIDYNCCEDCASRNYED